MSVAEAASYIGKTGLVSIDTIKVPVKVTDARINFGRIDLTVTPIGGEGTASVSSSRFKESTKGG